MRLGFRLSRDRFEGEAQAVFDVWMDCVVPKALSRKCEADGRVVSRDQGKD